LWGGGRKADNDYETLRDVAAKGSGKFKNGLSQAGAAGGGAGARLLPLRGRRKSQISRVHLKQVELRRHFCQRTLHFKVQRGEALSWKFDLLGMANVFDIATRSCHIAWVHKNRDEQQKR